jgi:hypothetical protein
MTLKTYQTLFWVSATVVIGFFAWYAYLYSRGLVTFGFGAFTSGPATVNTTQEQLLEQTPSDFESEEPETLPQ